MMETQLFFRACLLGGVTGVAEFGLARVDRLRFIECFLGYWDIQSHWTVF